MKIKIDEPNRDKIRAALDEVQGSCTARLLTVDQILAYCQEITAIYRMIPKNALNGSTFTVDPNAQNFPNAYRWRPESTVAKVLYKNSKFWLVDLDRYTTAREGHDIEAHLTDAARAAIIEAYATPYRHKIFG